LPIEEIKLADAEATEAFGQSFAQRLKPGDIVKITGPLGAGKTTMVRGIVATLGGDPEEVHSPTFALVHRYETRNETVNHCDFYRLETNSQLDEFGGLEFFDEAEIFLVEWPERVGLWDLIPSERLLCLDLQHDADGRIVRVFPPPAR
jgi:tRNA threonylcarbamoyladenosine biosynthesis protein TsaE